MRQSAGFCLLWFGEYLCNWRGDGSTTTLKAAKEVILAAGAFHTPKLLEISGVGAKDRLSALGIPVVLDHAGVGESLQNHVVGVLPVPLASRPDLQDLTPYIKAKVFARLDPEEQSSFWLRLPAPTAHPTAPSRRLSSRSSKAPTKLPHS